MPLPHRTRGGQAPQIVTWIISCQASDGKIPLPRLALSLSTCQCLLWRDQRAVAAQTGKAFDWEKYKAQAQAVGGAKAAAKVWHPQDEASVAVLEVKTPHQEIVEQLGVSPALVVWSKQVLREAPDIAAQVLAGESSIGAPGAPMQIELADQLDMTPLVSRSPAPVPWLNKGKAFDWDEYASRGYRHCSPGMPSQNELAEQLNVQRDMLTKTALVLREAPDVAEQVLAGV